MADWVVIGLSAGLSLVMPGAILCIRNTVKHQRQEIISALEAIFDPTPASHPRDKVVPSFEFVKFKYFLGFAGPGEDRGRRRRDYPLAIFLAAALPLAAVVFLLGVVSFGALADTLSRIAKFPPPERIPVVPLLSETPLATNYWLAALIVAYFASYVFVVRSLMQAVHNFDLSPASFLAGALHILSAALTAALLPLAATEVFGRAFEPLLGAFILGAVAIGLIPDLGIRTLIRATRLSLFKREDDQVYQAFSATPVEVIDGIDSVIRSRLSDYHIVTVQNLATANPIMLFVETPYGVYQIIDWVAQAQLCAAFGPKTLTELWKLDIRTIFDFERAMTDEGFTTPRLRHVVGGVMLAGGPEYRKRLGLDDEPTDASDATLTALARIIIDDLHVQRLRQIWNRISERLGPENRDMAPRPHDPAPPCGSPRDQDTRRAAERAPARDGSGRPPARPLLTGAATER